MTLEELRLECGWTRNELARRANVDFNTVNKALTGNTISISTAYKIASAISQRLGRTIRFQDIENLKVKT